MPFHQTDNGLATDVHYLTHYLTGLVYMHAKINNCRSKQDINTNLRFTQFLEDMGFEFIVLLLDTHTRSTPSVNWLVIGSDTTNRLMHASKCVIVSPHTLKLMCYCVIHSAWNDESQSRLYFSEEGHRHLWNQILFQHHLGIAKLLNLRGLSENMN